MWQSYLSDNFTCKPQHLYHDMLCIQLFVAFPWVVTSTGPGGFTICVCLLFDGITRRLMEKPGIEPATPGLQDIGCFAYNVYTFAVRATDGSTCPCYLHSFS